MSVLKKYNQGTSQWEPVVIGKQGNSGTIAVTAPITNSGTSNAAVLGFDANYLGQAAGRNLVINGGFDIWQRGTSFSNPNGAFTADRWRAYRDGSGSTVTLTQQTFTPGSAPVAGYEGQYFLRVAQTVAGTGANYNAFANPIEDVRALAGQIATISFWAKTPTTQVLQAVQVEQIFGGGGSSTVYTAFPSLNGVTITSNWVRYSATVTVPSIAGKTVGTNSFLNLAFVLPNNTVQTIDIWGVQLEVGSVATPFSRAGGTIQGELAACQRYYVRYGPSAISASVFPYGVATSTTNVGFIVPAPVKMRVKPTSVEFPPSMRLFDSVSGVGVISGMGLGVGTGSELLELNATSSGLTTYRNYQIIAQDGQVGYIGFSAEL